MARYVSTKTAGGGSSGGGAGISLAEVCTAVCNTVCKLATQTPASQPSPLIMPGFGCWEMVCNCPCWTECYGCCAIWCVDTSKYKGFKIRYNGVRSRGCCYTYLYPGFGNDSCFCCCNYAYRGACICQWPFKSAVGWTAYNCCSMHMNACVFCCQSQWDSGWSWEMSIFAPSWKGCTSGAQGTGVWYDWWFPKFIRCCDCYCYTGCDRQKGQTYCSCLFWGPGQDSTSGNHVTRMCMRFEYTPFEPVTNGGQYQVAGGGDQLVGQPCWTIWGIPCDRPCFGTCCMSTS